MRSLVCLLVLLSFACSNNARSNNSVLLGKNENILNQNLKTETIQNVDSEPFTLKKNESKQMNGFNIKMLSVGHTISEKGHKFYANLEISANGQISKPTIYVSEEIRLGDKYLKLISISEKADVKLSDPFSATYCRLVISDKPSFSESPKTQVSPKFKPTLVKAKYAEIRLGYGKKNELVDLDNTADVTLGGESNHRYKLYFATVKDDKIYYLFQVQSGPALSNPSGFCGGDSPQTLVWLKTDLNLKVEEAKSEVFASCAYNGGRYLQGKIQISTTNLKLVFEQQKTKTVLTYNNSMPEKGFEIKELN